MALDTEAARTRRTFLAGTLGATAALVASGLGRADAVRAHDPDDVALGDVNYGDHSTVVHCLVEGGAALAGHSKDGHGLEGTTDSTGDRSGVMGSATAATGNAYGVHGRSPSRHGTGVFGQATANIGGTGVWGECRSPDGKGVYGYGGAYGVYGDANGTGVYGHSGGEKSGVVGYAGVIDMDLPAPAPKPKTGVFGICTIDTAAVGVRGESTVGTGMYAVATTTKGFALRTSGRVRIDKASGVATIAPGNATATVTPGLDLSSSSFVLLTPRADIGSRRLWYTTDSASNTITIHVSSAVTASLAVGWLLLG